MPRLPLKPQWHIITLALTTVLAWVGLSFAGPFVTSYGRSYQVNVGPAGLNIPGDAANEPSMCLDPLNPDNLAVGWRQFDTTNSSFRQAGWAYSTNGGLNWTFPGSLVTGQFRSDPVLAADASGVFYYLGITNANNFYCELQRSTNGGKTWQSLGWALGGDKEWMAIDTTSGPGRGNFYQIWSPWYNYANNSSQKMFTRSTDGGHTWLEAVPLPQWPYFGTVDIGPNGEVYVVGANAGTATGTPFVFDRSTNAWNAAITPSFDLATTVNLGGPLIFGMAALNPDGLLGQVWVAADRSTNSTRGNIYLLCSVTNDPGNWANVMFSRSTNGGVSWSAPVRINDDSSTQHACHWFGTLSVAPNGRIDACWNDTRNSTNNSTSELYYSWSDDGGLTWAANRRISPPFDHSLGFPVQRKMGDYIAMTSLEGSACIAYTATFNGEEDIFFVRPELPIIAVASMGTNGMNISWNAVPGGNYCVQVITDVSAPWSAGSNVACVTSTGYSASVSDTATTAFSPRYYRIVRQP